MPGKCEYCGTGLWPKTSRRYCGVVCQIMANCSGAHDPTQCWVWTGATRENGYATMRATISGEARMIAPYRAMYAAINGDVPAGASVLNTCRTKNCCNPKHLKLHVQSVRVTCQAVPSASMPCHRV